MEINNLKKKHHDNQWLDKCIQGIVDDTKLHLLRMSNSKTLKKRKNEVSGSDTSFNSGLDSDLEVHD